MSNTAAAAERAHALVTEVIEKNSRTYADYHGNKIRSADLAAGIVLKLITEQLLRDDRAASERIASLLQGEADRGTAHAAVWQQAARIARDGVAACSADNRQAEAWDMADREPAATEGKS